jgi:response regulator NasT
MQRGNLNEHDAHRRLQKMASDKNLKLAELAHMIVTADEALS